MTMPLSAGLRRLQQAPEPEAILVRTPNWLGDLVVSTGFIAALLDRFPKARVDLVVRAGFEVLPLPQRGKILTFDRHTVSAGSFGASLRSQGYSHLFVLPPSFSAAWMAYRSGIPWRIGYRGDGRSWLLHPAARHRYVPRSVHLLQEYLGLLEAWGDLRAAQFPPRLAATPAWITQQRRATVPWKNRPIVLAPGAEYGPAKQWPAGHYGEVARGLARQGWEIVVAGLPKDRALGQAILEGVEQGYNVCGETNLAQLTALIADAALLISNDSGAMHLAAALGTPQIAVFGSTNPTWTGPINPQGRILYRGEWCSPCYGRTCRFGHTRCLVELLPGGVVEEAQELLLAVPKGPVA